MTTKKNPKTTKATKKTKNEKRIARKLEKNDEGKRKADPQKTTIFQKNTELANEDKMLKKIEKYVEKSREKTLHEMIERKKKRPTEKTQKWDLEVMISRISAESKPKEKIKEFSKILTYIIYTIIIVATLIFITKWFTS